jgi:hypothetical protein
MRERILYGWDESKCIKHKQDAKDGHFKTGCETKGVCDYTKQKHVILSYEEYQLLYDVLDFVNTNEMLTKDRERRQSIIYLAGKLNEFQQKKREIDNGTKRSQDKGKRTR